MKTTGLMLVAGIMLFSPTLAAQEDPAFIFAMYLRCNQAVEAQADQAVQEVWAPVIQRHVDAGRLTGWAWLTHSQGGAWRRILATTGSDMAEMMQVRQEVVAEVSQNTEAINRLSTACPGHDDYIWMATTTSTANPAVAGAASLSSYHMCDRSKEVRADQIFSEVLAPLYQKHVDMGHLSTFGFWAHRAGGVFRRLETVSGPDHATVLTMQGAVYTEAGQTHPYEMQEFASICQTHTDYMWTNTAANN